MYWHVLVNVTDFQFHLNPVSGSGVRFCGWTDGRKEGAFLRRAPPLNGLHPLVPPPSTQTTARPGISRRS
jgi:hypothetical protein